MKGVVVEMYDCFRKDLEQVLDNLSLAGVLVSAMVDDVHIKVQSTKYLGLVISYIDEQYHFKSVTANFTPHFHSPELLPSIQYEASRLIQSFLDYSKSLLGIQRFYGATSDHGSDVFTSCDKLDDNDSYEYCISHLLNRCIEDGLTKGFVHDLKSTVSLAAGYKNGVKFQAVQMDTGETVKVLSYDSKR